MATEAAAKARRSHMPRYQRRALVGSLLVASPGVAALIAAVFLDGRLDVWTAAAIVVAAVAITAVLARWHYRRMIYPLNTLGSLLEALRQGDYSLRGAREGVLGDLIYDINALAERLQQERLKFEESSHLLGKTLSALDSAVIVFDQASRLRLANPAASALLGAERHRLFGCTAAELKLEALLDQPSGQMVQYVFGGRSGRFEVRHAPLRSDGRSGRLLVINDLSRLLREEERQAWQRLLRVLGHEVNNSLAPIQSMAGTLASLASRESLPDDWREDFRCGLELIGQRSGALARFLSSYSRLARLPPPRRRHVDLASMAERVARLEQRLPVRIESGDALPVDADPDQLEQALINLLRNAAEAAVPACGDVVLRWRRDGSMAMVEIEDSGPGPPPSENLFVPFFTTKPGGSGIGLALARQIAEGHGGGVSLGRRDDHGGAVARLWIPFDTSDSRADNIAPE